MRVFLFAQFLCGFHSAISLPLLSGELGQRNTIFQLLRRRGYSALQETIHDVCCVVLWLGCGSWTSLLLWVGLVCLAGLLFWYARGIQYRGRGGGGGSQEG